MLDGGLYTGLYFIGAVSSLGKTTFTLQIADNLAKQGRDVLCFFLEQVRPDEQINKPEKLFLLPQKRTSHKQCKVQSFDHAEVKLKMKSLRERSRLMRILHSTFSYMRVYGTLLSERSGKR